MTTPILLTGGTGTLGRLVAPRLRAAGRDVRILSRHPHEPRTASRGSTQRCTASRPVYISVVGADRVPVASGLDRAMFGYYASKRAAELVVAGSDCPGPPCAPPSSTTSC